MHSYHRRNVSDTSAFSKEVSLINTDSNLHASNSLSSQTSYTGNKGWNPFEETFVRVPDHETVEDQLFGHEFDKIRKGSQTS